MTIEVIKPSPEDASSEDLLEGEALQFTGSGDVMLRSPWHFITFYKNGRAPSVYTAKAPQVTDYLPSEKLPKGTVIKITVN